MVDVHESTGGAVGVLLFLNGQFVTVQGDEIFIAEILVPQQNLVVGKDHGTVSFGFIKGFDLFGGKTSVGDGGMAVHIYLIEGTSGGKEILFLGKSFRLGQRSRRRPETRIRRRNNCIRETAKAAT